MSDQCLKEVVSWAKDPGSSPYSEVEAEILMESIQSCLSELQLLGCSVSSKAQFYESNKIFKPDPLLEDTIQVILKGKTQRDQEDPDDQQNPENPGAQTFHKLLILHGENIFRLGLKLNRVFEQKTKIKNNYIFQDLSAIIGKGMKELVLPAVERITLMVISCDFKDLNLKDVETCLNSLLEKQDVCCNLKIIFLVDNKDRDCLDKILKGCGRLVKAVKIDVNESEEEDNSNTTACEKSEP
jgi:hypothetical protein